jgi:hypothetical protein
MRSLLAVRPIVLAQPRYARDETPPFARGRTYADGATIDSSDLTNLIGQDIEGKDWVFEDINPNTGIQRTNHSVRCRAIRNMASFNLLPSRVLAVFTTTAGRQESRAGGYTTTTAADVLGVVDEYLPAAGVPQYDVFWAVIDGPTVVYTDIAAAAGNLITLGQRVVALTAVTSGATTAGRVAVQTLAATTLLVADASQIMNVIGRALTAATTANTNTGILVYVGSR